MIVSDAPRSIVCVQSRGEAGKWLAAGVFMLLFLTFSTALAVGRGDWTGVLVCVGIGALFGAYTAAMLRRAIWPATLAISPVGIELRRKGRTRALRWDQLGKVRLLGSGRAPSLFLPGANGAKSAIFGGFEEPSARLIGVIEKARETWSAHPSIPATAILAEFPAVPKAWTPRDFAFGLAIGFVAIVAINVLAGSRWLEGVDGRVKLVGVVIAAFAVFFGRMAWRNARRLRDAV